MRAPWAAILAVAAALLVAETVQSMPLRAMPQPLSLLETEQQVADPRCHGVSSGEDTVGVPARAPNTGSCCNGFYCPYTRSRCCAESHSCCPFDAVCVAGTSPKCHWTQSGKPLVNPTKAEPSTASKWHLPPNKLGPMPVVNASEQKEVKVESKVVVAPAKLANVTPLLVTPQPEPQMLGSAWPPMGALGVDGRSGMWDARVDLDWRGYGMIRNGTKNILPDMESCLDQCQIMEECRLAFYDYVTKECWLDSEFASMSDACPHDGDGSYVQRCASFFKKMTEDELERYEYGQTDTNPKHWNFTNMKDMLAPEKRSLVRNGFYNKVEDFHECLGQCAELKYCRALTFFRPTRECWLASQPAKEGLLCARRNGVRDCVSAEKQPVESELGEINDEVHNLRQGLDDAPQHEGSDEDHPATANDAVAKIAETLNARKKKRHHKHAKGWKGKRKNGHAKGKRGKTKNGHKTKKQTKTKKANTTHKKKTKTTHKKKKKKTSTAHKKKTHKKKHGKKH